jgi:hypothetical protein
MRMFGRHVIVCGILVLATGVAARCTENGASVYPVGVETVLPGMTPGSGRTMLFEFMTFYSANEFVDGHGKSMATEFKLRVFANAFRAEHGWNAHFWGGTLVSNVAVPLIYQQLHVLPGKFTEFGVGNIGIEVLGVGHQKPVLVLRSGHLAPRHWLFQQQRSEHRATQLRGRSGGRFHLPL